MGEIGEGFIAPTQLRPSKSESEERHRVGATHPTLGLVNREFQRPVQVPCNARFDPFTGAPTAYEDEHIIRMSFANR